MKSTVRVSVQRLRQIIKVHTFSFNITSLIVLVLLGVLNLVNIDAIGNITIQNYDISLSAILILVIAVTPLIISFGSFLLEQFAGIEKVISNVERLKQNLFISFGILWSSSIAHVAMLILDGNSLALSLSAVMILVSWVAVIRLVVSYMRS